MLFGLNLSNEIARLKNSSSAVASEISGKRSQVLVQLDCYVVKDCKQEDFGDRRTQGDLNEAKGLELKY
jgi:hypothetical protein